LGFIITAISAFVVALSLGLGSAWYMIAEGSPLTTERIGPWSTWYATGTPDPDPYTRAHQARTGHLPLTSTSARYYFARSDASGAPLRSRCDYSILGQPINALWWSLALYDDNGRLIPNKAERHAFSRTDILREPDGSFRITLASKVRPGNWLPSGEDRQLQLVLRVYAPRNPSDPLQGSGPEHNLPEIRKEECR
jgi:hypothetical protein